MSTAQVRNLMAEIKLPGSAQVFEKTLMEATEHKWSYSEFLDVLLQAEFDHRNEQKSRRRVQASKLKIRAAFEDFDFTARRSITKIQVKEIFAMKWLEQARPLLLIGQTGIGKTFIAQAAGLHACEHGKSVLFMDITTWMESLALARSTGSYLKFRAKLSKPDLLIIDDFGMRKLSAMEAQDLCEIFEERSLGKSTIITTQLPLDHWGEVIPDVVIADAIIDRLKHLALQIAISGESYRSVKAKKLEKENKGN